MIHANPGADLTTLSNRLTAGNTLVLNDGTYSPTTDSGAQAPWYVTGIHGTPGSPILIEAAHDGGATIDGSNGNLSDAATMWVRNSSYVTLCGFDLRDGRSDEAGHGVSLLRVGGDGSGPAFPNSDSNLTFERITAHNAGSGNANCFNIAWNDVTTDAHIILQDDAAWGRCRYGFVAYHARGVTFRRDWSYGAYATDFTPAPRCSFGSYGAQDDIFENDIGTGTLPSGTDKNFYCGQYVTTDDETHYPNHNSFWYGDIYYNNCAGVIHNGLASDGVTAKDLFIANPARRTCSARQGASYAPDAVADGNRRVVDTLSNLAITDSNIGVAVVSHIAPTVKNSVFASNTRDFTGAVTHTYNDFYGPGPHPAPGIGDVTTSPNYNTTTYGRGAYLMPAPALLGQGANGADMGAHIIYDYIDGALTTIPLWPWPMESRIIADTAISVTYESGGGLWKTLAGVYSERGRSN